MYVCIYVRINGHTIISDIHVVI